MQEKEPWKKVPSNKEEPISADNQKQIDNCLHICLQLTANLAIFINPFLPFTAKKMCKMMKVVEKMLEWRNGGRLKLLSVGYTLKAPELLFRKIEDAEIKEQVDKLEKASQSSASEQAITNKIQETGSKRQDTGGKEQETGSKAVESNINNL